jgi:CelD/BcsL family acetyltransferase involved in cellulose biosynthesis
MPGRADWTAAWTFGGVFTDPDVRRAWTAAQPSPLGHVFHRLDLMKMWTDTIGAAAGAAPAMASLASDSGLTGLVAVAVVPHRGSMVTRRVLEPMGQDLFGYHDPLFDRQPPAAAVDAFWSTLRSSAPAHDQARFRFVDGALAPASFQAPSGDDSPVLSLEGAATLDDVLGRCSANHRGDVRRRLRRLCERGAVALRVYGRDEAGAAVRDFGERCWPAWVAACRRKGGRLFERPGFRAYCDRLLDEGVTSGLAHYSALRVDGVDIAWHLGLSDRDRLYWWLPAHDADWDDSSPGKVLLALLIEHAIGARFRELHFQTGAQPYKLAWQPARPRRVAVVWHAGSWRGRAFGTYDALRERRWAHR